MGRRRRRVQFLNFPLFEIIVCDFVDFHKHVGCMRCAQGHMSHIYAGTCKITWLDVSFERKIRRRYHFHLRPTHVR
jgi:hypothetical protein